MQSMSIRQRKAHKNHANTAQENTCKACPDRKLEGSTLEGQQASLLNRPSIFAHRSFDWEP